MSKRPRGLGSGLGALLPTASETGGVREVPPESIRQNPRQPRTYFEETALDELAASIREHGIIQPLIVSQSSDGTYELIAGERRWRAAQRAQLARVPVIVRETTPQQLLELALLENVQRADLNPIEEARAYETLKSEFSLNDETIATRLGKSRVAIANTRRLLQLIPKAQEALLTSQISAGHGRALLMLKSDEYQVPALAAIIEHGLTVRDAERISDLAREYNGDIERVLEEVVQPRASSETAKPASRRKAEPRAASQSAEDKHVERELETLLSTPVQVARSAKDVRVTIVFHTDESLQAFFDSLQAIKDH